MSRRALSLTAYLALTKGRLRPPDTSGWPHRPDGALLWLHAESHGQAKTLLSLADRLEQQLGSLQVLVTCENELFVNADRPEVLTVATPQESQAAIAQFLSYWRPDVCLWASNCLRPALIVQATDAGCRMILADARDEGWNLPRATWFPDTISATLQLFELVFAVNDAASRRLRRIGVSSNRIEVLGALDDDILALPCSEDLRAEVASLIVGRPVWLAAHVELNEVDSILRAHQRTVRLAHRLLLVLVPESGGDEETIEKLARAAGLRVALWENGDMPDENTQVLLASDGEELGLWYRLAPLCFLGGSLTSSVGGHSPMMAAVLGSAVLYGPNVGRHLADYSQLVEAGAARIVKDSDSLHTAVSFLITPDRAAAMAHAGWQVIAARAETNDRIINALAELLEGDEAAS